VSAIDCARAILKYVPDPAAATVLVAIAGAESGWNLGAKGDYHNSGDCPANWCQGYCSWGPWQINVCCHSGWIGAHIGNSDPCAVAQWLTSDWDNSAWAAAKVYTDHGGLCAWSVYEEWCGPGHNGRYRGYLAEAKAAVDAVLGERPPACPEGTYQDPVTGQCVSIKPPSWPLWLLPVLTIPAGLAGAGLIFMSRKNMTFDDVKLLLRRWSYGG